jgi:hypothetical protein
MKIIKKISLKELDIKKYFIGMRLTYFNNKNRTI